jgi:phage gpG-like protein
MAGSISVDASQMTAFGQRCAGAKPMIEQTFRYAMVRSVAAVQHDAMVAAPVDTGTLRRSIAVDVTPYVGTIGSALVYAPVVEFGRRAGQPMPPAGALLEWMRRHGIDPSVEFVIRRKIRQHGIKARPYLIPALDRHRPRIEREFDLAIERLLKRLAA